MKTFKDIVFEPHPIFEGLIGKLNFKNGYGISVIRFKLCDMEYGSYTNDEQQWEIAVLHNNKVTYNTPITDDVIGYLYSYEVTEIMKKIQELPIDNKGKL